MNTLPPAELPHLQLGFMPLLDCVLLVVARERGLFADQGLEVTLSRQNAWSTLRDKVAAGLLDGAHMLAPMPLAMSLGLERAPCDTLAPITLSRNGNAIVLSRELADACSARLGDDPAASARALAGFLPGTSRPPRLAMVYPHSCQHYQLRHWLGLGSIDANRTVELVALPPPRMVDAMQQGKIDGFCVGEPWGSLAEHRQAGRIVASGAQLWPDQPEKVLGVTRSWARHYPATLARLIRALVAASDWLAESPAHRRQARDWLALPPYLDRSVEHLETLPFDTPPLRQRLCGIDVLRPDPVFAERLADQLDQHLRGRGQRLDLATLGECYSAVHFDRALHH
ncbi:CmpA/NrtA family ABC transporter substrate-binding protein [Halomonas tibetensis]|uniref:CmpA/NrtA family ABC transporter substrate-binding protein n=1 Tax=Halomonas tibetensis TaxID=2259590 RepID=A0ABV7B1R0_9GAMM